MKIESARLTSARQALRYGADLLESISFSDNPVRLLDEVWEQTREARMWIKEVKKELEAKMFAVRKGRDD